MIFLIKGFTERRTHYDYDHNFDLRFALSVHPFLGPTCLFNCLQLMLFTSMLATKKFV